VIDLTYVGWVARHMEQYTNINVVPDGAKFLDKNPQNVNPQNTANAKPDDFLRPYAGYGDIIVRSDFGTANYNGLQVQINRRYIRGLQFAIAYTYSKAMGLTDEDESQISVVRPRRAWHYAPNSPNQLHNLVINYTWDIPKASKLWNNPVIKLLFDDWQLSGENAFASGDWGSVSVATLDNFDFTGGTGGNAAAMPGSGSNGLRVVRPNVVGNPRGDGNATPDAAGNWLNAGAFTRPARGEYGNAPRLYYRLPAINNWNLAVFKNFPLGSNSKRRLQLRLEGYNVLNHTQFSAIDNTARFDADGNQVNAAFGKATAARNPRILVGSARVSF
jgi:hypothetical protein